METYVKGLLEVLLPHLAHDQVLIHSFLVLLACSIETQHTG